MHANPEGTNKSSIKLNTAENKLDIVICWQMGKTSRKAKTSLSNFKITAPKNPLINNQVITSIKNLTNYTGLS